MEPQATFEHTIAELEKVVERLQRPDLPLDEAVALYRRGTELSQTSESLLSGAELQVQKLTQVVRERFVEYEAFGDGDGSDDT